MGEVLGVSPFLPYNGCGGRGSVATQEIFIGGKSHAVIMCLKCGREKTLDVSKLKGLSKQVRVKCSCGFTFEVVFEKRAHYRKKTQLPGQYSKVCLNGYPDDMIVINISRTGLGLETFGTGGTKEGDVLKVEFRLDNATETLIKAEIVVRNVNGRYIGGEFCLIEEHAKRTLGFYLMP
jgi:hypothetical protein